MLTYGSKLHIFRSMKLSLQQDEQDEERKGRDRNKKGRHHVMSPEIGDKLHALTPSG